MHNVAYICCSGCWRSCLLAPGVNGCHFLAGRAVLNHFLLHSTDFLSSFTFLQVSFILSEVEHPLLHEALENSAPVCYSLSLWKPSEIRANLMRKQQREQNTDVHAKFKKVLLSKLPEQCGDSSGSRLSARIFCSLTHLTQITLPSVKKKHFYFLPYCSQQSDQAANSMIVLLQPWPWH